MLYERTAFSPLPQHAGACTVFQLTYIVENMVSHRIGCLLHTSGTKDEDLVNLCKQNKTKLTKQIWNEGKTAKMKGSLSSAAGAHNVARTSMILVKDLICITCMDSESTATIPLFVKYSCQLPNESLMGLDNVSRCVQG